MDIEQAKKLITEVWGGEVSGESVMTNYQTKEAVRYFNVKFGPDEENVRWSEKRLLDYVTNDWNSYGRTLLAQGITNKLIVDSHNQALGNVPRM